MSHVPRLTSQPSCPIQLDRVWKRYRLGSHHDSLRDAIPSLLRRWTGRNGHAAETEEAFWALQDVSFQVKKGETLGIVGPNGAGKSTILKLLSRITTQTKGTMRVHGRLAALIELGGGFHPDLSGAENIYLQGTMLGLSHREVRRLYDSIVAFSEIDQFLQTPIKRYSSGMVVRLGFAIAAHVHPEVLLIDEVLAVGDLAFQQKCFSRIDELRQQGTTMIFISHNLEAVQKLCDRVLVLQQGRVIEEGSPTDMVRRYREGILTGVLKPSIAPQSLRQPGALQIRQVTLRDREGAVIESLATGESLRIDVEYRAARPITQPTFRIGIERLDGLLCHASSSHHQNGLPQQLVGEGTVTLEYPVISLLPNVYQVIVEIFEGNGPIPIASVRQGCFFQVTSDHQEYGTIHLDHRWSFDGSPVGSAEAVKQEADND